MASSTIQKTMMTSQIFEGFWDRWIAHGIERQVVTTFRSQIKSLDLWVNLIAESARKYEALAESFTAQGIPRDAERLYRNSGLHYNLIQWIFPETCSEKRMWFTKCKEQFKLADSLTKDRIIEAVIRVDGKDCFGRIRIPENPQGCIVIINPIDSSKEELYSYEMDFAKLRFITLSFDGPGQGETYVFHEHKATVSNWILFVDQVIQLAADRFPNLPIHLFGTSSGANWAIQGSSHPKVKRAAAVSPAFDNQIKMPDYFRERLSYILDDSEGKLLPILNNFNQFSPIILFHGNKDVMVRDEDVYKLFRNLPLKKKLIEYENEGHCCNFKLAEIRQISAKWFGGLTYDI